MEVKDVMKQYFLDLDRASRDPKRKVAWCTSVGPAEILRAMDFEVYFPENHGAMLGATRVSSETIPVANAYGYSPDICSYLTSDVGAYLQKLTPLTKAYGISEIPRPDVLVYCTNQCKDVMHWFEFFGREFKAPVIGLHPPNHLSEVEPHHVTDLVAQYEMMIGELQIITGAKLDFQKLRRAISLSSEATQLWSDVLETAKRKPSPLSFFDGSVYMGPIVVLRGTETARDFYQALHAEMLARIASDKPAVPGEKARLYWDGMPVWGRLRSLSELFAKNHACIVASTYCNSWIFPDFDPDDALPGLARAYLKIFINRNDAYKQSYILKQLSAFGVNGVIFHEAKTCPNNSNSQYRLPAKLREAGVPSVTINGDLCDLRCFSDDQSATIIEAFLETL